MGNSASVYSSTPTDPALTSIFGNSGSYTIQPSVQNVNVSSNINNIIVTWNASIPVVNDPSTGDISKYRIYLYNDETPYYYIDIDVNETNNFLISFRETISCDILERGKTYNIIIYAYNNSGQSDPSDIKSVYVLTKQTPPTNIVVSSNQYNQSTINWVPDEGIYDGEVTKYTIYYYDSNDNSGNIDVSANETSYNINSLVGGEYYTFFMTVSNSLSESIASDNTSILILQQQPSPVILSVTSKFANKANITWTNEIVIGFPVTGYTIYYDSSDNSGNVDVSPIDTSYTVDNLVGGYELYNFYMTASNNNGISNHSNIVNVNILQEQTPPNNFTVVSTIINTAIVNWSPANEVNSGQVTEYTIYYYKSDNSNNIIKIVINNSNDTSYNIENLNGGEEYTFSMTATNDYNESLKTNNINIFILSQQPPTDISGISNHSNQATITWTEASGITSFPVIKYTIYYYLNIEPLNVFQQDISAGNTSVIINNLLNPNTYIFNMTASNFYCESIKTSDILVDLLELQPSPIISLLSSSNLNQATINWTSPNTINGLPIIYYTIYYNTTTEPLIIFNTVVESYKSLYTINNLSGYTYTFYMTATNSYGESIKTTGQDISLLKVQPPPSDVIISSLNNNIIINWNQALQVSTGPVQKYSIYYYRNDASNNPTRIDVSANITTYTISGLVILSNYTVYMTATNIYSQSIPQYSQPTNITLYSQQPPPTNVNAVSNNYNQATVMWNSAATIAGSGPVTKYTIYYYATDNSNNILIQDASANVNSYTLNNLVGGKQYKFSVSASNSHNTSILPTYVSLTILQQQAPPTNINAVSNNFNEATIDWMSAITVYGGPVIKYTIYYYQNDNSNNIITRDLSSNITSFNFNSLVTGNYTFKMTASNYYSESILTTNVNVLVLQRQTPPINLDYLFTILNEVTITWEPAELVYQGGPIIKYTIYYYTSDNLSNITYIDVNPNVTSLFFSSLISQKIYYFNITASNVNGESLHTSNITVVNQLISFPPYNFSGICSDINEITVNWDIFQIPRHPVTKFTIYYFIGDSSNNTLICDISANDTSTVFTNLIRGKKYTFRITATNDNGESNSSPNIVILNQFGLATPTNVLALSNNINTAIVHWMKPILMPGRIVTKYTIYYYNIDNSNNITHQDVNIRDRRFIFNLSGGETFTFYMTAWYGPVETINSNTSTVKILSSIPPPVSNICFPEKTPVRTDQGLIHIDLINPDFHTIHKKKIIAITRTITQDKNLVCIEKDSFGPNIPCEKTIITCNHKILYNGKMTKAKNFVGQINNVKNVPYNGEVLYNVLMEEPNKMMINNLICETLDPINSIAELYTKYNLNNLSNYNKIQLINHFNNYVIKKNIYSSSKK